MPQTPTCLIEQNPLFREGLKSFLKKADFSPVKELSSFDDYKKSSYQNDEFKLIVINAQQLSDDLENAITLLKTEHKTVAIIVLSNSFDREKIVTSFSAGADGFLLKDISAKALIASLNLVLSGEKVFPTSMASIIASGWDHWNIVAKTETAANTEFSQRAEEIIGYLVEGCSNKTIARNLDITESTVKVHLKAILRKLELANRTQVAIWAISNGIKKPLNSH